MTTWRYVRDDWPNHKPSPWRTLHIYSPSAQMHTYTRCPLPLFSPLFFQYYTIRMPCCLRVLCGHSLSMSILGRDHLLIPHAWEKCQNRMVGTPVGPIFLVKLILQNGFAYIYSSLFFLYPRQGDNNDASEFDCADSNQLDMTTVIWQQDSFNRSFEFETRFRHQRQTYITWRLRSIRVALSSF